MLKSTERGDATVCHFSLTIVPYHTNCEKLYAPIGWQRVVRFSLESEAVYRNAFLYYTLNEVVGNGRRQYSTA
jgi:hypothetical protein